MTLPVTKDDRENLKFVESPTRTNKSAIEVYVGGGIDMDKVKVSDNDQTSGYLVAKVIAGENITVTETDDGSSETLVISSTATSGGGDEDRTFFASTVSAIGLSVKRIASQVSNLFEIKVYFSL